MALEGLVPCEVQGVELVRVNLPLSRPWASEAGTFSHRDSLLVRVVLRCPGPSGEPVTSEGWGECTALPAPTYSAEYTAAAVRVAGDHIVPSLFARRPTSYSEVLPALAPVKGNNMAKAAFEAAWVDAELRAAGRSLAAHLASSSRLSGTRRPVSRQSVVGGAAVGLGSSEDAAIDEVEARVAEGYRRVKLKIVPGTANRLLSAVRSRWPDLVLMADANGGYAGMVRDDVVRELASLDELGLACIEQPLADDDLVGHADLAKRIATPVCLDEPITSVAALRAALELGACSVVNVKAGRMGGLSQAVKAHDECVVAGVAAWCGGMVETGIGRAANVALASLSGFTLPGDLSATGRFFADDVTSSIPLRPDGTLLVPAQAGTGVEVRTDAIERWSTWRRWYRP